MVIQLLRIFLRVEILNRVENGVTKSKFGEVKFETSFGKYVVNCSLNIQKLRKIWNEKFRFYFHYCLFLHDKDKDVANILGLIILSKFDTITEMKIWEGKF